MERNPLISVIVPVYNAEPYLDKCVASILGQSYANLEVILVNDGSTDASGAICDTYAAKDSRIRVVHKTNGGQSSARNMALDMFTGEYVTFVDSDDWIEPDAYEKMLEMLLQYDQKLVSAGRYDVDSATEEKRLGLCPAKTEVITAEEMLGRLFTWDGCDSSPCDKMYHRSLFDEIRFPLTSGSEDIAVVYRLIEAAGSAAMYPKPIYNYYHRANSTSTTTDITEKIFHFAGHTAKVYPYIRETYPNIENQVRNFRIRSLVYTVLTCDMAGKGEWRPFAEQYHTCRKELRSHLPFIMRSSLFTKQERRQYFLLATGLYSGLRDLYYRFK